uniref:Glutathione S-transferase omega n=1 Tax=Tigriopus japonicus TaxID=158387 RepID=B3VHS2_TIGJA|nr:glutathione S-transferase omega [Tigriopus japonicus]
MSSWSPSLLNNMNSRHLGANDPMPPINPDVYTVFNLRFCPYAQRTILFLLAKQIPFENVNIDLKNKPGWFLAINPLGKVPTLVRGSAVIYESLICDDFLEEEHPETKRLLRDTPLERAMDKLLVERSKFFYGPLHGLMKVKTQEDLEKVKGQVQGGIQILGDELRSRGTDFFGGSMPGMVDYSIWPWFERFNAFAQLSKIDLNDPTLQSWMSKMFEDEAVRYYRIEDNDHTEFWRGFAQGQQNYDILYQKNYSQKL